MTILLIDNDRNQHEMFREVVRRIDPTHKCLKAFSIESALESLLEDDCILPDLIFLDLEFRVSGGKQMLKALKESTVLKEIPVCIYTDSIEQSDRDETCEMGAIGYIVKEQNLTNMSASIKSIIASSQRVTPEIQH
jgi:DNA-binding response OmpR family regulator